VTKTGSVSDGYILYETNDILMQQDS
jgi:hypothetical protein